MNGQLTTIDSVKGFALAGNARLTVRSTRTGTRFTYRLRQSKDKAVTFVSVLTGTDNESDYEFFGTLKPDGRFVGSSRSRVTLEAPSAKAFVWLWTALAADHLPGTVEVWHEGRCGRCGRALTVPESLATGLGPECVTKMAS